MIFARVYTRLFVFADRNSRALWLCAAVAVSAWAVATYNAEPWLSYKNVPFPALSNIVRQGEPVPLRVIRCNAMDTPQIYTVARTLEHVRSGRQFVLPDSIVKLEPGCTDETSLVNVVPRDPSMPLGTYRVLGLSQIQSEFRIRFVGWSSEEFEVIP